MSKRVPQNERWRVPDELSDRLEPLLPRYRTGKLGRRPRVDRRRVCDGILFVLRTGGQWNAAPSEFGSSSTVHRHFQDWTMRGVYFRLWKEALREYDELQGIDWGWQSLDGAMMKAPLGGEKTGANPTDRGKPGKKRSLLTDGDGVPLALVVSGANTHDKLLVESTLKSFAVRRALPRPGGRKQHFCGDKGYDYVDTRALVRDWRYNLHIRSRGQEEKARKSNPRFRAYGWVVERRRSWFNRFRRILIRWEKKAINYGAMLHFACAIIMLQQAGVLG